MYENSIFLYNRKRKIIFGLSVIFGIILAILIIIALTSLDLFKGTFIEIIMNYIKTEISSATLIGLFLAAIFGGLFFLPIPMEIVFITFVSKNNPLLSIVVMICGLLISYPINYLIGLKFSNFSRKLISAKQFYTIKAKINRYGKMAIFIFNVLPLPSQPLTFICGVFRYNKTRLFIIALSAWIIKLTIIAYGLKYILMLKFW